MRRVCNRCPPTACRSPRALCAAFRPLGPELYHRQRRLGTRPRISAREILKIEYPAAQSIARGGMESAHKPSLGPASQSCSATRSADIRGKRAFQLTSMIRFLIISSSVLTLSSVTTGVTLATCSKSRSSSSNEFSGRDREVASPSNVQSFGPIASCSSSAICLASASCCFSCVDRSAHHQLESVLEDDNHTFA